MSTDSFSGKLSVYAVQTGWSNWGGIMEAFEQRYGLPLNDDQRSSGGFARLRRRFPDRRW